MNLILKLTGSCQIIFLFFVCLFSRKTVAVYDDNGVQNIKWMTQTQNDPVYEKDMLELLNNMETLEPVNQEGIMRLRFEERDINLLTKKCSNRSCVNEKETAITKYKRKIEALQCVNAAIVYTALLNMNYFLFKQGNIDYQKTAARMLSLLYNAKITAHNWLWSFYFRMGSPDDYKTLEVDKYYPERRLQDEIIQHLELCRSYKYLPPDFGNNVAEEKYEKDKLMRIRQYFYKDENTNLLYLKKIYSEAKYFNLKNLMLSNVYNNQNLLFHKLGNVEVSWEETKLLLNKVKLRPTDSTSYSLIMRIIKLNILYLLWKHSNIFYVSLKRTFFDPAMNLTNRKISEFQNAILYGFDLAIQNIGLLNDLLFINILHNLKQKIQGNILINRKLCKNLEEMNNNLKNIIVEDLIELDVKPHQIEVLFRPNNIPSNIDQMTNLNLPQYREHIDQLLSYGETVKKILEPINFYVLELFINGKSKLVETFFMY
ncbi:uncharacterized protein LOC126898504 [Daktulosphaira vitifoliae]|uniref:uncharacterized protein LOC126898504 n=1 Tax=Daktulosphaira vitifoliae TaxID=58002 RepID=UPI0021AA171B|nr:uncharacterized protein LOC126898504 [Daktulosphaira vitifoliae]